jgi:hypothetical protein
MNIVRARYQDPFSFLEIKSITHGFTANGSLGMGLDIKSDSSATTYKPSLGVSCSQSPSMMFMPLDGKSLTQMLETPIQTSILLSSIQSGWSISRVFGICLERLNNVRNAPTASGPTPVFNPDYETFRRMLELLNIMQQNYLFEIGEHPDYAFPDKMFYIKENARFAAQIAEFKEIAGLDKMRTAYKIKDNFTDLSPKKITLRPRSLGAILFFLSQGVDVPKADEKAGIVRVTKNRHDGSRFSWDDILHNYIHVRCCEGYARPKNAYVAYRYRNKWFYILDSDLDSKSTLTFLSRLLNMQTAPLVRNEPVIMLQG